MSPRNRSSERRIVQSLRRIGIEILVGFVGVYAAFALSAYKEKRDLVDRRHQIKRALIRELTPLVYVSHVNAGSYGVYATEFDSLLKAGKKPIPRPFIEPMSLGMHMWEATKQGGGLSLIDVETFSQISNFYNKWSQMDAFYSQLRELSVHTILPESSRGVDAFYDPRTGRLRPDVAAIYVYDLRALDVLSSDGARDGAALIAILAKDTI